MKRIVVTLGHLVELLNTLRMVDSFIPAFIANLLTFVFFISNNSNILADIASVKI